MHPHFPASCRGVIVVGSYNDAQEKSSYSNYGDTVDIYAPGGDTNRGIVSTYINPNDDSPVFAELAGTSMAAPHVAGIVATIRSVSGNVPTEIMKKFLNDYGDSGAFGKKISMRNTVNNLDKISAISLDGKDHGNREEEADEVITCGNISGPTSSNYGALIFGLLFSMCILRLTNFTRAYV